MIIKSQKFSKKTALIYFGLCISLAVASFLLSYFGVVSTAYKEMPALAVLCALTLAAVTPVCLYLSTKFTWGTLLSFISVHVGLALFFTLYIGPYSPFTSLWAVLLVLTYTNYGRVGFFVSAFIFTAMSVQSVFPYKEQLDAEGSASFATFIVLAFILSAATVIVAMIFCLVLSNAKKTNKLLVEARRAESVQLNRLDTLLNSLSDTVLTLNRYGRITSQNSSALSFFDTNQSLVGKSIDTILDLQDASMQPISAKQLMESVKATLFRDDVSVRRGESEIVRLSIQMSKIQGTYQDNEDQEFGVVLIIRDITRQKTLEDEKDEFISVTSHELRTPIAIAEGSLSNLVFMQEKGGKPELLKKAAETAHDQVLYLARMINDLSTLSRAERGVGDVAEEVDVKQLVQDLFTRYEAEAQEKSLQLNLDVDASIPTVMTSRLYLEEILQNFITNAIKYTVSGSVTLEAHMKSGRIECSVSDTGIGINKVDQKKIFEKFFRSEDYRTRETSGTGLGLYVVRKLADKLDTTVEVESKLNHGSKFSFILPLSSDKLGTGKRASNI